MDAKFIRAVAAVSLACFLLGLLAGLGRGRHDGRMIVQQSPLAPGPAPGTPGQQRAAPGSINL